MGYRGPLSPGGAAVILVSALIATLGCHRHKAASREFESANRLFVRVYAEKLEDAYVDPRMGQVEQLLNEVAVDSADYAAAQQLQARIRTEIRRAERLRPQVVDLLHGAADRGGQWIVL